MRNFENQDFRQYWRKTEVIREYEQTLFTFGDMELPYTFAAEHSSLSDRVVVRKGTVFIRKPHIVLPGHTGPEFLEGFKHGEAIPPDAAYMFRAMGLPYSKITNRPASKESIEYGSLQTVLDRLDAIMNDNEDSRTGLIKGEIEGEDVSLMRYTIGLIVKSAPGNVSEFMEHIHRQRDEPIRPDEMISDEDIRRLFG